MSAFILDASYALAWCFPDRATASTDATLKRWEGRGDNATVPWVWQVEVGNALGNGRWFDAYLCGVVPRSYVPPRDRPARGCIPPKSAGGSR